MNLGNNSILDDLKIKVQAGGIVIQIIAVNVVLFLLGWLLEIIEWAFQLQPKDVLVNLVNKWTYVPSELGEFIIKPFTLITYQFLHAGFFHIFFNMLIFYYFAQLVSSFINSKKILPIYLMGGIAGGLVYLLLYNTIPVLVAENAMLVGASAAVMAIVGVQTYLTPEMEIRIFFFFRVRLKYVALGLILINFFTVESSGNAGGNLAHLGGIGFGFLYMYLLNNGKDLAKPFNRFFDWIVSLFERKKTPTVTFRNVYKSQTNFNKTKPTENQQEKLDAILDKIAANGYESLTKSEKDYLFKYSKE